MTPVDARVAAAEAAANLARERLQGTVGEIAHRLHPATIAGDATESAKAKAKALTDSATEAALDRPVAAGAGAGLLAGFIGWRLLRKRGGGSSAPDTHSHDHINKEQMDHGRNEDSVTPAGAVGADEPVVAHG